VVTGMTAPAMARFEVRYSDLVRYSTACFYHGL
jgi:hypothetical protein